MLYQFLKILVRLALKVFFKRIYISGLEHIKPDRPQLIASNHPSGFLEPLIMACFFPKSLHFLVRGDIFDKKWLRPLLLSTHQIPVFRFKDGFSKLRENPHSMDASSQILSENKNLLIFVEGSTQSIKKLRPLQKGIARIGFQALDKNPDINLEIVPVGINFTFSSLFNDEVMLKVGNPISVQSYYDQYKEDKNHAIDHILHDTYQAMLPNVIHLEDQTQLPAFEELVLLTRKSHLIQNPLPVYVNSEIRTDAEIKLANGFNILDTATRRSIDEQIKKLKISFANKIQATSDMLKSKLDFIRGFILIIGFLPAMIGLLCHILPIAGGWIFMRAKVKQREFKSSLLFVVTLVLILIQYILVFIIALLLHASWWIILPICLTSGLWARFYHRLWSTTMFSNSKNIEDYSSALNNIQYTYLP